MRSSSLSGFIACLSLSFAVPVLGGPIKVTSKGLLPRQSRPTCSALAQVGQTVAEPYYPAAFNPDTCPDNIDGNLLTSPLTGHDKRSLALTPAPAPTTGDLSKRQGREVCQLIARQVFDHYMDRRRIANTGEVQLIPGLRYVFAMSTCALVERINVYLNTGGGHFDRVESFPINNGPVEETRISVSLGVERAGQYHFEVFFEENIFQDGIIRLYQLGQG
ncbi:MAG: hypothetical protein Q9174_006110 [Haloplaca sp. 1 TL-2023]